VLITDDVALEIATGGRVMIPHHKQRHGAGVYCVVLSSEGDAATREARLAAGADAVFCKLLGGRPPPPADRGRPRAADVNGG